MVRGIYRDSILWDISDICHETCTLFLWSIISCTNVYNRCGASPGMIFEAEESPYGRAEHPGGLSRPHRGLRRSVATSGDQRRARERIRTEAGQKVYLRFCDQKSACPLIRPLVRLWSPRSVAERREARGGREGASECS